MTGTKLCKVVSINGDLILPEEVKLPETPWDRFANDLLRLVRNNVQFDQILVYLQENYTLDGKRSETK